MTAVLAGLADGLYALLPRCPLSLQGGPDVFVHDRNNVLRNYS